MSRAQGIKIGTGAAKNEDQNPSSNEQMNMRIRRILNSFNASLPKGEVSNPDPGHKLGK
jgi:hypothetical protein